MMMRVSHSYSSTAVICEKNGFLQSGLEDFPLGLARAIVGATLVNDMLDLSSCRKGVPFETFQLLFAAVCNEPCLAYLTCPCIQAPWRGRCKACHIYIAIIPHYLSVACVRQATELRCVMLSVASSMDYPDCAPDNHAWWPCHRFLIFLSTT